MGQAGVEERGLGFPIGRSSSNMMSPHLGASGSVYNQEQDQYVVNFDELLKKSTLESSFKTSPRAAMPNIAVNNYSLIYFRWTTRQR